jgi:hypothetical protein
MESCVSSSIGDCEVEAGLFADDGADDGGGVGLGVDGAGVSGGQLEGVEDCGGSAGVDAVACEGGDDQRNGDLDGFGVFEGRKVQLDFGCDWVDCRLVWVNSVADSARLRWFSTRFLWRRWRREWK